MVPFFGGCLLSAGSALFCGGVAREFGLVCLVSWRERLFGFVSLPFLTEFGLFLDFFHQVAISFRLVSTNYVYF